MSLNYRRPTLEFCGSKPLYQVVPSGYDETGAPVSLLFPPAPVDDGATSTATPSKVAEATSTAEKAEAVPPAELGAESTADEGSATARPRSKKVEKTEKKVEKSVEALALCNKLNRDFYLTNTKFYVRLGPKNFAEEKGIYLSSLLLAILINENEPCLVPYGGGCTELDAAERSGRRVLAFEIDPQRASYAAIRTGCYSHDVKGDPLLPTDHGISISLRETIAAYLQGMF